MARKKTNLESIPITKDFNQSQQIGEAMIKKGVFDRPDLVFAPGFEVLEKIGNKITKVKLRCISLIPDKRYKKWGK